MPDKEPKNQNEFVVEKIKMRPINRRKLIRRTIITATMAVIFGLIACFTFLILEPVISNWLYPEEDPQIVVLPEDQEEMSPEEMLAENLPTESPSPSPSASPESTENPQEEGEESPEDVPLEIYLDRSHYAQIYQSLYDYIYNGYMDEEGNDAKAISQYLVTIRGVTSNIDWFDNVQESSNQASGVVVADNGKEFLVLVDYTSLRDAESLVLELEDVDGRIDARLKGLDVETDLAIIAVDQSAVPAEWVETGYMSVAPLGSSNGNQLVGTPVIAVGSPMGMNGSIGYGMITSSSMRLSAPDRNYRLLLTDITGSRNAEGVLFNLQGQVIGIITDNKTGNDMQNLINAYGITEMKRIIEKLSNESAFAYLGISGVDVTSDARQNLGVPNGAYVTELEMDSPAMLAGIQVGDVIIAMNDSTVQSFGTYSMLLMRQQPGDTVTLTVMRQAQEEYKEMSFSIETGKL